MTTTPPRARELAQLDERHPIYAGKSTNQVCRLKGFILASFATTGLPDEALPFVLEELQSGRDPYVVAAAAKALRGAGEPAAWMAPFLLDAVRHIGGADDMFTFDTPEVIWPITHATTARGELRRTIEWIGPSARSAAAALESAGSIAAEVASCCPLPSGIEQMVRRVWPSRSGRRTAWYDDLLFEDQNGRSVTGADLFTGKPSIVAFFYTRCTNPGKCSLTITNLAEIQRMLRAAGLDRDVRLLAISYDPAYDTPPRLKAYTSARALACGEHVRALRCRRGFETLVSRFDLHFSSSGVIVSAHAIELGIVRANGELAVSFSRLRWSPHAVVDAVKPLLRAAAPARLKRLGSPLAIPASMIAALVPKCPVCWAGYFALAGLSGVMPWLAPVAAAFVISGVALVLWRGKRAQRVRL